jgi:hypothetical protein
VQLTLDFKAPACETLSSATCMQSRCVVADGGCVSACAGIVDLQTCSGTHSAEMVLTDYVWECRWVDCQGTPDKPNCSQFSTDQCPAARGCMVEKVNSF